MPGLTNHYSLCVLVIEYFVKTQRALQHYLCEAVIRKEANTAMGEVTKKMPKGKQNRRIKLTFPNKPVIFVKGEQLFFFLIGILLTFLILTLFKDGH